MRRLAAIASLSTLMLAGCAAKPIPDGYTGPLATVSDTVVQTGGSSGRFFVLRQIDDRYIEDSITRTTNANSGRGLSMQVVPTIHRIPAQPATVRLQGKIHYAAPILALINPSYEVEGTVAFDPKPEGRYVVRGGLGEAYSSIWIVDLAPGQPATAKIERR